MTRVDFSTIASLCVSIAVGIWNGSVAATDTGIANRDDGAFMVGVGGFSKAVCNEKGVRDLKEIGAEDTLPVECRFAEEEVPERHMLRFVARPVNAFGGKGAPISTPWCEMGIKAVASNSNYRQPNNKGQ